MSKNINATKTKAKRRAVTNSEMRAIEALYKLRSSALESGSFDKKFVKNIYGFAVYHKQPGISEKQAAYLWKLHDKYRAQIEASASEADKLDRYNFVFLKDLGKSIRD